MGQESGASGLSRQEETFCLLYAALHDAREAAAAAGYPAASAREDALALLARPPIRRRVGSLLKRRRVGSAQIAEDGLLRLAFGGVSDAVRLMLREDQLSDEELQRLDLYCVSTLKRVKGGGFELTLCDRQKALECLLRLWQETPGENDAAQQFFRAIQKGVASEGGCPDE